MRKDILVFTLLVLFVFGFGNYLFASESNWQDIGRGNLDVRAACLVFDNPRVIYIGSKNRVLKTEDAGESWRTLLSVNGQNSSINFLYQNKDRVYAASGSGLFYSPDQGKSWQRIFKGKNYLENECRSLAVSGGNLYLATAGGLFLSKDEGRSWQRVAGLDKQDIFCVIPDAREKSCLYLACAVGVFKSQDGGYSWKKTFFVYSQGEKTDEEPAGEEREGAADNAVYISIDPYNPGFIYLATPRGIYKSNNKAESWEPLFGFGFIERGVRFISVSNKGSIYALNSRDIFEYKRGYWQKISYELEAGELRSLILDKEGNLYLCTAKGLFKTNTFYIGSEKAGVNIPAYFKDEPDILRIQQAAIRYAEVSPDKIERWRKQAAKKAWLPSVSVGLDRNTADLWHWEGGSTTKADDDVLRKGRSTLEWDVSLSWDLSELIWSDDQTNIDVRSRLMVELRDDILDNVTKLYFERLRLKTELDGLAIEERKKRAEKELKLRELSASLDALTGGYFSMLVEAQGKRQGAVD